VGDIGDVGVDGVGDVGGLVVVLLPSVSFIAL
jgi:hypothetical protein